MRLSFRGGGPSMPRFLDALSAGHWSALFLSMFFLLVLGMILLKEIGDRREEKVAARLRGLDDPQARKWLNALDTRKPKNKNP